MRQDVHEIRGDVSGVGPNPKTPFLMIQAEGEVIEVRRQAQFAASVS